MLCLAAVAALMIPPTPPEFRWLNIFLISLAGFWAVMFGIEDFLNHPRRGVQDRKQERIAPGFDGDASDIFAPPPPHPRHKDR
jgi:hypothetical protein